MCGRCRFRQHRPAGAGKGRGKGFDHRFTQNFGDGFGAIFGGFEQELVMHRSDDPGVIAVQPRMHEFEGAQHRIGP